MKEKSSTLALLVSLCSLLILGSAFAPPSLSRASQLAFEAGIARSNPEMIVMMAAGKKNRRRRKQPPGSATPEAESTSATHEESPSQPINTAAPAVEKLETAEDIEEFDLSQLSDVAKFKFVPEDSKSDEMTKPEAKSGEPIPLPDITQVLQKKAIEDSAKAEEEENKEQQVKINRKDKVAFARLLEQQPYADADDSFFEEQEYNTVSALLGERAKPFLGLPTGPLQVGHIIGALVIVLMSFVEYPGFPLTNLPSPLRGALQGGLGTVYGINLVLAVLAVFKAGERGQPALLWFAKTFAAGGLSYDQLTQLPTLEEIEKVKSQKGARALKNKKKY